MVANGPVIQVPVINTGTIQLDTEIRRWSGKSGYPVQPGNWVSLQTI